MKKLLFIDCCIRREESRTRTIADAFLKEIASKGEYQIERLVLMDENLECLKEGFFRQRHELIESHHLDHARFRYAHQFAEADRIVIAAPFWDLGFPALLKIYIENVSVDGITFASSPSGCQGICRAEHMAFFTSRGDFYEGSDQEMGARYLDALCQFFGIGQFTSIAADGLDVEPAKAEKTLAKAKEKAVLLAQTF
jgi:FMN-dependent NADH-azoreductase